MYPFGKIPLPAKWDRKNDPPSLIFTIRNLAVG